MATRTCSQVDRLGLRGCLRKALCLLLALSMAMPWALTAQAAETGDGQRQPEHTEHTEECGYRAATPGAPCKYDALCDQKCKDTDGDWQIDHARSCAYTLALEKDLCDKECKDSDGDGLIDHAQDCTFTLAKGKHTHSASCGYKQPEEAKRAPAPEDETTAPEDETTVPESETTAPEVETTAPEDETTAPEDETTAPEDETTAPEDEATAPEDETTAPESETTAPEGETTAPEDETTAPEKTLVQFVQELMDALPEAVTAENAEEVKAQLAAIDTAKVDLTEEELDALDITRYMAAVEALAALEGMAGADELQTLEGTGQYQFNLQFINIPSDVTVTYTVRDESGNELISEQTLIVTNGSGSAIVYADALPIKIRVAAKNASGGEYARPDSLSAPGTWTWNFNSGTYFSLSHDHTGETEQWVKQDESFHIKTYPCGITEGGPVPHEFTDGVCELCRAEQPVYTVYALLPDQVEYFCHKAEADAGGLEGDYSYYDMDTDGRMWFLWVFPLPASYQGEIYFQGDSRRFPEGEGTLALGVEQGAWFYNGETKDWAPHSEDNHIFPHEGDPCAVCGKTEEYSAYELYAVLPNTGTPLHCFAYLNDPSSGESPILEIPMTYNPAGYWYRQLTTDQSFMSIAVAPEESVPNAAYYIPKKPDSPPEGIAVPDPSVRKLIYLDGGLRDHDKYYTDSNSLYHYRIDGTCIVCGDSLPLVAEVEGRLYTSLEEAWDAACDAYTNKTEKAPVTVTLLGNAAVEYTLTLSGEDLILEGGEYTVTFNDYRHDIEIHDGKLTLNSGTIENKAGNAVILRGGSFVMNGGTIEATGNSNSVGVWGNGGTVTISGGSVYGQKYAVQCDPYAHVAISGGSFRADTNNTPGAAGLYVDSEHVKLSGGTFDSVQCNGPTVDQLLETGYTYYGGDGSEVTPTGKNLLNVTVKADASGNLDLHDVTADQSGAGYSWDADTHTLTLTNANIAGDIIFADNVGPITVQVEGDSKVGGDIKIEKGDTYTSSYQLTIQGPKSLYVAGHLGTDGENGNQITIDTDADVTAAGGVSASASGGVDGTLTVKGTLTAIGNNRPAVFIGNVKIDGGTLNVSGAKGVSVGGTYDGRTTNYENAFVITSGTFNANCTDYNLVCEIGGGNAPDITADQVFNIPSGYLPAGYAAQRFIDGAAVAKTNSGITSAYASGGGSLTLSANPSGEYTVRVVNPAEGGTAEASASTAKQYAKITMTAAPESGYHLVGWDVKKADGTDVPITKNTFVMPASNVTVTPVFAEKKDLADHVSVKAASRVYNGKAQETTVTVQYEGISLVKGRDYTVAYSDNKDAGTRATITITGVGSYQGEFHAYFDIAPKPVTATVTAENKDYDGNTNATVNATVDTGVAGETLTVTGLTGAFSDANVGTGKTVTIDATKAVITAGTGTNLRNYNVSYPATATADITPAAMTVSASGYDGIYDRAAHGITVTVTAPEGATVKYGEAEGACTQDSLTYTDAGNHIIYYEVTKANYTTVTGSATVNITPKTVDDPTIELSPESFTYDGTEKMPVVTVKDGEAVISDREYGVSYRDNVNAGTDTAKVTVTADHDGNYIFSSIEKAFTIAPASISTAAVTVTGSYTYTGAGHTPNGNQVTVMMGEKKLAEGTDYTLSYSGNVGAGTATVTVNGKGNYKDTAGENFTIDPAKLTITGAALEEKTYDGGTDAPVASVTFDGLQNGESLTVGAGCTATAAFTDKNAGTGKTANVTVKLDDTVTNYQLQSGVFTLNNQTIRQAEVIVTVTAKDKTYDGQPFQAAATLDGAVNGENIPVTLTYTKQGEPAPLSAAPTDAGTYTVTATIADPNYRLADTSRTFTIGKADISGAEVTVNGSYTYSSTAIVPSVTVQLGEKTLVEGTDYEITATNNTNAGTASFTVTGIGNYGGAKGGNTFPIAKKQLTVTITSNGGAAGQVIAPAEAALDPSEIAAGDTPPTVKLTYTGTAYDGTAVNSVDVPQKAGTYTVTAAISDPTSNYALKEPTTAAFIVRQPITVTIDSLTKTYGDPDPKLTYQVMGDLIQDIDLDIQLSRAVGENEGSYAITAASDTAAKNPSYEITVTDGTLAINKKDIRNATVILGPALIANGKPQIQTVESVTVTNGKGEKLDVTYTVIGSTGTKAGGYAMTITGTENFEGTVTKSFAIAPGAGQPVDTDGNGNLILGKGIITVRVSQDKNTPAVSLVTSKVEILEILVQDGSVTAQELAQVADGTDLKIVFTVENSASVSTEDQSKIKALVKGYTVGSWLDISLYKQLGDGEPEPVYETDKPITLTIQVPENLLSTKKNETRTFRIVRCHDGKAEFLDTAYQGGKLTFETDRFSSYAIVYTTKKLADKTSPQTSDSFQIQLWITVMLISAAGTGTLATVNRKKKT